MDFIFVGRNLKTSLIWKKLIYQIIGGFRIVPTEMDTGFNLTS